VLGVFCWAASGWAENGGQKGEIMPGGNSMLKILDLCERFAAVMMFATFCAATLHSHHWQNLLILVSEVLTIAFILTRRSTDAVSQKPLDWALAFAGTMAPWLVRPGTEPLSQSAGVALLVIGTAVAIAAKLSLNRSFGLAPANRGVKRRGAYVFVRHPMYLGYFIAQAGFLLLNPTLQNLAAYAFAWAIQIARLLREEAWLSADPEYRAYADHVRFRLIPGAF
jgi:protein-S-isoprenylcysteine O-methyltransferase Ste14